jgi:scyllo-inositol 2-dehydrogenase (NADP+)
MLPASTRENREVIRVGIVGLGKMGLSHLAILRAHPAVSVVAACDSNGYLTDVLQKYAGLRCFANYERMLLEQGMDAILIATPSRFHAPMVKVALSKGLHVFCEKPFVLDSTVGRELAEDAHRRGLVTQVGYHYRFVGAFQEAQRLVQSGALGRVHALRAEAYGPVVLRSKGGTWRSEKSEGGGALYDYACHAIDLVNFTVGQPVRVSGVARKSIFSSDVDDEVYATLHLRDGVAGQLCVNWSDDSFRKMSTKISIWGTNGKVVADRQECQLYLRTSCAELPDTKVGWTVRYTTELTKDAWYYLRGEEYSAQIDYFARSIQMSRTDGVNCFSSALATDSVVDLLRSADSQERATQEQVRSEIVGQQRKRRWALWGK